MSIMREPNSGRHAPIIEEISRAEQVDLSQLCSDIVAGRVVVIPGRGSARPIAIGHSVRSKVLCNFGTSSRSPDMELEIRKANASIMIGASLICDQSVGPNVAQSRKRLIQSISVPLASIPLYQNADSARQTKNNPLDFTASDLLAVFEDQLSQGVTAPGIHTMTRELKKHVDSSRRIMPLVSRGGSIIASWIQRTGNENPYIAHFDDVLAACDRFGVPLTLVCSCRAGCIEDGFDSVQKAEIEIVGELVTRAHRRGVAVMVDGLGHMRMDQIPDAVASYKRACNCVPLGVMGPATTDRGLAHEHVVNAIGTAIAVQHGANYCNACARTEHLGLPEASDIPDAIGAAVVATYAGDLARGKYRELDLQMAEARKMNAWGVQLNLALDKTGATETFRRVGADNRQGDGCSICGDLCPFTISRYTS